METINIQFQVPSTGQYTLDEFVAKLKDYAEKLASSISKSGNSYQETYMSQAEQEAYVAESLNRALDELEAHKKNGTKPMDARELLTRASLRHNLKTPHSLLTASVAAVRSAYCQVATCTTVSLPVDCLQIESVIYHPFYQL